MTVRAIADHANVNSALLGYYFNNKETLAREMIRFSLQRLNDHRKTVLGELKTQSSDAISVEALICAYAEPFLVKKHPLHHETRAFLNITAHVLGQPKDPLARFARSINRNINEIFIEEIAKSLPDIDNNSLHFRFEMMLGAMVFTSALVHGPKGMAYFSDDLFENDASLSHFTRDWAATFSFAAPALSAADHKSPLKSARKAGRK